MQPKDHTEQIRELENRLAEAEQLIEAIKAGEVDAFALIKDDQPQVYTLQSGDYAYRVLVESFTEGAVNLSEDGLIVYTNISFYEMLRLSYEEVIGKNIFQFIHPHSTDTFRELFRKGIAGQSQGEIDFVSKENTYPGYVSLTSLYPNLPTVGMIVHDLSEKKTQEKILKQSEEKFNKLFYASPLALALSEVPSGIIVDANDGYFELTGYAREECIGRSAQDLHLIDDEERERILVMLEQDGFVKNVEVAVTRKDGEIIPVLKSMENVIIGERNYLLTALIDIVERKKVERRIEEKNTELQNMNKELQAFTYVSSHDLQEPLRKIQLFAGRIIDKEKKKLSATTKDYFMRMQDAASRMQRLIQDLLSFSRITTYERKLEKTDLNLILEDIKAEFRELIEAKSATILARDLCSIRIIPFQFHQLMQNLVSNSLKFSRPGIPPMIQVKTVIAKGKTFELDFLSPDVDYCHIAVSDNGIGFEEKFSNKIFEVFQKLHTKDEYPGTGIGLAIVKKIVENHNGIIRAKGEINKGATFDIYLPV
jgi:PAS domain S-box-containing protein